ncbi:MAG: glutamate-5-semialdehyde dehydrogenase [Sphingobacteriaceae bacterium]|nr:glutamate-5-semialdehyde dehydrogenase [Cytophagaceae bacterium]
MTQTEPPTILPQLAATYAAAAQVRRLTDGQKTALLNDLADAVLENGAKILAANAKDLARMPRSDPKWDRLLLTENRLESLTAAIRDVAQLPDPSGQVLLEKTLPNGLNLRKMAVPMGVIGIIYESRPNVTLDVTALCLRSGNAVVLRGGSDAYDTNLVLVAIIQETLRKNGLSPDAVTLLPSDRELVKEMLTATRYIDLIIPRGSDSLIQFVRQHSLVPTIETGAGVVHTYVEKTADLEKARAIVVNARVSRPSVCNSLDCLLVDAVIAPVFLPMLNEELLKWNVEVYADEAAFSIFEESGYPLLHRAQPEDFGREWLDFKLSVKTVAGFDEALAHLEAHSSRHSEAILTENQTLAQRFLAEVDAAAVYVNASTRFTDGGEFGLGAEIGISTQKLHARGPFALEKLVTEKWLVVGEGQVRW